MLKSGDFFILLRLFRKMNIRNELKNMITDVSGKSKDEIEKLQEEKGAEAVFLILENLDKAENEVYQLISHYKDIEVEEIKKQSIGEFTKDLFDIIEDKSFKSFFDLAVQ